MSRAPNHTQSTLRIGTRGSELALTQAREVRDRLVQAGVRKDTEIEIEVIRTTGDRITDRPLADLGGKGLFTKEIEEQLIDGRIDLAVHSAKDMPTQLPAGLELSAFLPRQDPRDAFICNTVASIEALPAGAVVGTASLRRQALVRRYRPDLQVTTLRGNVGTRLRKLADGAIDATLLALAGLNRLDQADAATQPLDLDTFPPAPGQGAICIESRVGDEVVRAAIAPLKHGETETVLAAERAFLAALDGSCRTPLAGHATVDGGVLRFHGLVISPDGGQVHEVRRDADVGEAEAVGRDAGEELRAVAGAGFFADWN